MPCRIEAVLRSKGGPTYCSVPDQDEWMNEFLKQSAIKQRTFVARATLIFVSDSHRRQEASNLTAIWEHWAITEIQLYTDGSQIICCCFFHRKHTIIQWRKCSNCFSLRGWLINSSSQWKICACDVLPHSSSKISSMSLVRKAKRYNTLLESQIPVVFQYQYALRFGDRRDHGRGHPKCLAVKGQCINGVLTRSCENLFCEVWKKAGWRCAHFLCSEWQMWRAYGRVSLRIWLSTAAYYTMWASTTL